MVAGAHTLIFVEDPEKARAFFRDVLELPYVDEGDGWLIFGLPPAEVAVHPSDENDVHELYLMCDDVEAFVADMTKRRVSCGPVKNMGWGLLTHVVLPGGGKLGVYQARHARPPAWGAGEKTKTRTKTNKPARRAAGASAAKKKRAGRGTKASLKKASRGRVRKARRS